MIKKINKSNFYKIYDYFELNYNNYNIKLFHYPLLSWEGINKKKKIHLFGHTHNDLYNRHGLALNVGADTNNLSPYSFEEILTKIGLSK